MINEANASSSACRLWRVHMVETKCAPIQNFGEHIILQFAAWVKPEPAFDDLMRRVLLVKPEKKKAAAKRK
jgi:hypothetical protein